MAGYVGVRRRRIAGVNHKVEVEGVEDSEERANGAVPSRFETGERRLTHLDAGAHFHLREIPAFAVVAQNGSKIV